MKNQFIRFILDNCTRGEILKLIWWEMTANQKLKKFREGYEAGCSVYGCFQYAKL